MSKNDRSISRGTTVTKNGYVRSFLEQPATSGAVGLTGASDTFCYQSVPSSLGKTGVRGFGGDSSGLVQTNTGGACCTAMGINPVACSPLK